MRWISLVLLVQWLTTGTFACVYEENGVSSTPPNAWTYHTTSSSCAGTSSDPCGPAYWSKPYPACGGHRQSPVNIANAVPDANLTAPSLQALDEGCDHWIQFSNNYTYEVALVENGIPLCSSLSLTYNNAKYDLLQIHFHSPSEHTLGGGYFSAEAHLVHVNQVTKQLVVLGILLQENAFNIHTSNNTFFQMLWNYGAGDTLAGHTVDIEVPPGGTKLNPYDSLLPSRNSFYTYAGSLTTPPCSEVVTWIVYDQPVTISSSDLQILRGAISAKKLTTQVSSDGNNNRFPSPQLDGRTVHYSSGDTCTTNVQSSAQSNAGDDDETLLMTGQQSIGAIVIAVIAFIIACYATIRWYEMQQKLVQMQEVLQSLQRGNSADHVEMKVMTTTSPMAEKQDA